MINRFTQSMVNHFAKCGQSFYYYYIEGIRLPPTVEMHRGASVHASVNHDTERKIRTKDPTPMKVSDLQDITATEYDRRISTEGVLIDSSETKAQVLGENKDLAIRATTLYADAVSPRIQKPILSERTLSVDVTGFPVPLEGTIDIMDRTECSRIIDIKTATKRPTQDLASSIQPIFYDMLLKHSEEVSDEDKAATFNYEYLITQKRQSVAQTIERVVAETEHVALLGRIGKQFWSISAGVFHPAPPNAWWCGPKACDYYSICPFVKGRVTLQINGMKEDDE